MAKQLNKIPIAGSIVNWEGIELVAERPSGRRNKIGTVLATWVGDHDQDTPTDARSVEAATQITRALPDDDRSRSRDDSDDRGRTRKSGREEKAGKRAS